MCAFVDHGEHGTGEPLARDAAPGQGLAIDAADHIAVLDAALAQLPEDERAPGAGPRRHRCRRPRVPARTFTDLGLEYSVGSTAARTRSWTRSGVPDAGLARRARRDGRPARRRPGRRAHPLAARATLARGWPAGMRVIARRERPHPGAQLRLTDHDGWRITCFATNTHGRGGPGRPGGPAPATRPRRGPHPRPERHRPAQPALPRLRQNQIWLEIALSPPTCWPGPKPWPSPANPPDAGNPNDSGSGSSPSPDASSAPADDDSCDSPQLALEPPHRHRLDRTTTRLTHHHDPTTKDQENRRHATPEPHAAHTTQRTQSTTPSTTEPRRRVESWRGDVDRR